MVWSMRGGVSYTEVVNMSPQEREIILEVMDDNFKTTEKSGLPFF